MVNKLGDKNQREIKEKWRKTKGERETTDEKIYIRRRKLENKEAEEKRESEMKNTVEKRSLTRGIHLACF